MPTTEILLENAPGRKPGTYRNLSIVILLLRSAPPIGSRTSPSA